MHASPFQGALDVAAALDRREVSSVELVDEAIARIERFDDQINAVVVRDFDRARETATAADERRGRGERQPLLDVPMTVKESYNVVGLPQTWGFKEYATSCAQEDAVTVSRLKAAGAIILGKTNVPVALADWQSFNDIYGLSRNPWNLDYSPGGSFGGSAAALAAGYVPLELGSDIGGSIRVPAHFCGVFGHKATYGLIPGRGPALPGVTRSSDLSVCGPLARTAADLELALGILAGPDAEMAAAYRLALAAPRHAELREYRVLVIDEHPLVPTRQEIRAAVLACAQRLAAIGATVAYSSPLVPDLAEAGRVYIQLLGAETSLRQPPEQRKELAQRAATLDPNDHSLRALRIRTPNLSHAEWIALDERRMRIRAQWRALFEAFDVVLSPPLSIEAYPHDTATAHDRQQVDIDGQSVTLIDQLVWPGVATLGALPATVAPIGRTAAGLPIGLHIMGAQFEDLTTIAFAGLIERESGGFQAPPLAAYARREVGGDVRGPRSIN